MAQLNRGQKSHGSDHAKPKRDIPESSEAWDSHVRPAAGKQARRQRMKARREARRERMEAYAREYGPESDNAQSLRRMMPRGYRGTPQTLQPPDLQLDKKLVAPSNRVRPRGMVWMSWRWVSGIMSACLLIVLILMSNAEIFFVNSIAVGGVQYLTREEVFRFAGVSGEHIFRLDAAEIEAELEANNNIADTEVRLGWPPNLVQIIVREREPVLVWEQADDRVWVDVNGWVMFQREDRPSLLRVVYDPNEPQPLMTLGPDSRISEELVQGALLLDSSLTGIDVLLYHPIKGLGWRDPRGWMVWFGVGDNMAMKAIVYEALVAANIDAVQFGEVDLSDPDNPVYTVLWRKDNG